GNFGGLGISTPLTIDCEGAIASNTNGSAGTISYVSIRSLAATDLVVLRGLDIDGARVNTNGFTPIRVQSPVTLRLEKVRIANVPGATDGILVSPIGLVKLEVRDSVITGNATSGTRAGIHLVAAGSAQFTLMIEHSVISNNLFGIFAEAAQGATINGTVRDSVISGNVNNGISITTNGGKATLAIE